MPFSDIGGATALDFVNTRPSGPTGSAEKLQDFSDILEWALQFGLVTAVDARLIANSTEQALSKAYNGAIALRESLRNVLETDRVDTSLKQTIGVANALMALRIGHLELLRSDRRMNLQFVGRLTKPDHLVAAIAESISQFLAGEDMNRAKPCQGASCVLWFVDRTRNRSRNWCRMDRCGARVKSATYYKRHKVKRPERDTRSRPN